VQVLHLVKAQCSASSLVTKVKLIERCFDDGVEVEFYMYDAAPSAPPAPLPYFVNPDESIVSAENDLALHLATAGATRLIPGNDHEARISELLTTVSPGVSKAVKAAAKSKTPEVRRALATCTRSLRLTA
jgi:hypothetical protein